ncbi:alanine racemase [Enterobacteriaceae endosymbiont of Neohaemonia nigricornis]|uniref:alanine racemase n=1 Tax=Enterobacteriaceae endosymbiont of Neohaemonia nigricornis TaxID=2675792 RepID=UPI001449763F|nr:alanine racemase [Enterobacteriaceae endosymbiont of Neohaemonia nigricornis]QJC30228.1 alanine racemase [Enterobacteriaceae endosymbiont of Neohaemonia nigricornis]
MTRPIAAIINTKNIQHNLNVIRNLVFPSKIWSVLKANAYGHGINNIWKSLILTDGFAVLNLSEAIFLRKKYHNKPILLLEGFFNINDLYLIYKYNLTITIHSNWQLDILINYQPKYPINIYIKINTGMNRLGFKINNIHNIIYIIKKKINIKNIAFLAHFADCSKHSHYLFQELNIIKKTIDHYTYTRSFANSAAILWHEFMHYDWVRCGILLYGASPTSKWEDIKNLSIKPVMTLQSKIIGIQKLMPGETVGYNHQYCTNKKRRIGIIACGYGDGYPKNISNNTSILIHGTITKILGTVTMDMIAVDLFNIPTAKIGTKVELWGDNIKIDNIAQSANTISYELMCAISSRVPRIIK